MAGNVKSEEWESPEETEIIEVTPCTSKQPVNMVNVIIFTEYTTGLSIGMLNMVSSSLQLMTFVFVKMLNMWYAHATVIM